MKLFSKLSVLLTTLLLLGCQTPKSVDVPPVTIAFDHNNINQEYKMNVTIEDPRTYSVVMNYYLENPDAPYPFHNQEKTVNDMGELVDISGFKVLNDGEKGVSAKYLVKIYDRKKKEYIANELIDYPKIAAVYMGDYANLISVFLNKGKYTVYVTYLKGSPKLNSLITELEVSRAHHGK